MLRKTLKFSVFDVFSIETFSVNTIQTNDISDDKEIKWNASKIRSTFLKYFSEDLRHTIWPSSPVVPVNDNTLLFANAGMNQFKPVFLGTCDPNAAMAALKRAVNSQKCIRAGGKHNDLEDVGKDVYHHTFFEMLGNWSFGDYFKEEAITWAWRCLVDVFGIDPQRIYATYFQGDKSQGLQPDFESKEIWKRFLPDNRILPFGCKENFWEMGPTGPCGPCTEIHYDRIGDRDASALVNADLPEVIEIWNNVFIQYNRESDGSLKELPNKHVDTGMGFERLASILQNKTSNYDTDIFKPIFEAIHDKCKCRKYTGLVGVDDVDLVDMAYRVIGDHIRTLTFAITDGAQPSSDGRGYVLRRILRRAVRYGQEILHAPAGFFTELVPVVVENFSNAFPELAKRQQFVMSIIFEEEQSFNRTLDLGVKHFKKVVTSLEKSTEKIIPARDAHILYSSMGFPIDLTELMAAEKGFTVDTQGFRELMDSDRKLSEAAQAAKKGVGSKDLSLEAEQTSWLSSNSVDITDTSSKYIWNINLDCKVMALFKGRGGSTAGFVDFVSFEDDIVGVILDKSPFYYESGGQTFDTGFIANHDNSLQFAVLSCQIYGGYVVHIGHLLPGSFDLNVGMPVLSSVDYGRRSLIAPNHTMTHVMNYAIKKTLLGSAPHEISETSELCDQKGSLVDAEKLRFDFAWNGSLTIEQINSIESIVSQQISQELNVYSEVVPLEQATSINGLRKVFGEKYPDPVRIISVGTPIKSLITDPSNGEWKNYSIEFCGGTHLSNTKEAEHFVIVEESGISKGVRRIIGYTKMNAKEAKFNATVLFDRLKQMQDLNGAELRLAYKEIGRQIDQAIVSLTAKYEMKKILEDISKKLKMWLKENLAARMTAVDKLVDQIVNDSVATNKDFIVMELDLGADGKLVKRVQERVRKLHPSFSTVIFSSDDDGEKLSMFVSISENHLTLELDAKDVCNYVMQQLGTGKGGGKNDLANASFDVKENTITLVKEKTEEYLKTKLIHYSFF